ncbi:hypothetical protein PG991_009120 [Apiospora marii]|uniref:Uncharacterized protein n=1 Tax=Apiospora marii TaxID=335849 RepID=A0ABR1RJR2_9PEZI
MPLPPIPTTDQLDQQTTEVLSLLRRALEMVGRQPAKDGHGAPWWIDACREARDAFRRARRHHQGDWRHLEERKRFLAVVRKEKREYWRQRIDSIQSDKDLYEVVRWYKLQPALQAPPLVIDGRTIEDTEEKAHALRKTLLERFTDAEDLEDDPLEIPTSTSPRAEGISVRLLKACWHAIEEPVRYLFQAYLRIGHHPRPSTGPRLRLSTARADQAPESGQTPAQLPEAAVPSEKICAEAGAAERQGDSGEGVRSVAVNASRHPPRRFLGWVERT